MVVSMERWIGKVAVVTGASAGIGAAIAEALVNGGITVVGLARRTERVEELSKKLQGKEGKLHVVKADVTKEKDIIKAFEWVKNNLGPVHILINNAGMATLSSLLDGDTEGWKQTIDTNVLGLSIATREAVRSMRQNNVDGHIIHINSLAGHRAVGFAGLSLYSASKFALTALTETLRQELNSIGSKIKITSVSPGYVRTEFHSASGMVDIPEVKNIMDQAPGMESEDIADAVIYVLSTPSHVQVHELTILPVGSA